MPAVESTLSPELLTKLAKVRLLAMDVDGVLTDGVIVYDSTGGEQKHFHVTDGLGIAALLGAGYFVAWITSRNSAIVARRAAELKITRLVQGAHDKRTALHNLIQELHLTSEEAAYVGDDWNDLPAFAEAGMRIATANAVDEVKAQADVVTRFSGGQGAVREVCNLLLDAAGIRESALERYLSHLQNAGVSDRSVQ